MAEYSGICGVETDMFTATFNRKVEISVDIDNNCSCPVKVIFGYDEKRWFPTWDWNAMPPWGLTSVYEHVTSLSKTIQPKGNEPTHLQRDDVTDVSIRCIGDADDENDCEFTYTVGVNERYRGQCGRAEAVTAEFSERVHVRVDVTNTGTCPIKVRLGKIVVVPGVAFDATKYIRVLTRSLDVGQSTSPPLERDDVNWVTISCDGEAPSEESGERNCAFTYSITGG